MEVHFTPEQEAQLAQVAAYSGSNAEVLVKDAALRLLEEQERFVEAVNQGEAALDRGEFLTHDEVGERLGHFLKR
jgi:predicted transcriptional regulator